MGRDTRDSYRDRRDDNYPDDRGDSRRERSSRYQGSDAGGSGRLGGGSLIRQPRGAGERRNPTPERVDRRPGSDPRPRRETLLLPTPHTMSNPRARVITPARERTAGAVAVQMVMILRGAAAMDVAGWLRWRATCRGPCHAS